MPKSAGATKTRITGGVIVMSIRTMSGVTDSYKGYVIAVETRVNVNASRLQRGTRYHRKKQIYQAITR